MRRFLLVLALLAAGPAWAQSDSQVHVEDNVYGILPAGKLNVTIPNVGQMQLGAALGNTVPLSGGGPLTGYLPQEITTTLPASGPIQMGNLDTNLSIPAGSWSTNYQVNISRTLITGSGSNSGEIVGGGGYIRYGVSGTPAGTYTGTMDGMEVSIDNYSPITGGYNSLLLQPRNQSTGTIKNLYGVHWQYSNANTAADSVDAATAFQCDTNQGAGTAAKSLTCVNNNDPDSVIANSGHMLFRAGHPPSVTGCGTGASLNTRATDVTGTVTEGTGATGCTIVFGGQFSFGGNDVTPTCLVTSPNGSPNPTSALPNGLHLVIANTTTAGAQYAWHCL